VNLSHWGKFENCSAFLCVPGIWEQITAVAGVLSVTDWIEGGHPLLAGAGHWRDLPKEA
jgi:hypothetical protein